MLKAGLMEAFLILVFAAVGFPEYVHAGEDSKQESVNEKADTSEGTAEFKAPEYILQSIKIKGNHKTSRSLILKYLTVKKGEVFSEQAAELSRLKLLNIGYFTQVDLSLVKGSKPGRVVLVISVVERNTILVDSVDMGMNTLDVTPRVFGGIRVTEHNFLGQGILLSGAVAADDADQQAYELEVFVPIIGDTKLQLGGGLRYSYGRELFRKGMDYPKDDPDTTLNVRRIGGNIFLGWQFNPFLSMSGGFRFDWIGATGHPKFFEPPEAKPYDIPSSAADFSVRKGDSTLSAIILSITHDSRNDPFLPTEGLKANLALELGSRLLGGEYDYSKFTFAYEQAFPTWLDHSVRADAFFGLIYGKTPYFNKFFRSDLDLSPPRRLLGLDFYKDNEFGDFAISLGGEYNVPIFTTNGPFYRFVAFFAMDATMTGSIAEYFPLKDPNQEGRKQKTKINWPIDLTFDIGVKVDTYIGVFRLSVSYFTDKMRVAILHDD
ncbi:MAG: BamA/TamA family outer membrane protein [Deltaproteobacteria bacterium]|nr:BamA/TamA family outer membrane protein [Deltaproteobacteria bacterium]